MIELSRTALCHTEVTSFLPAIEHHSTREANTWRNADEESRTIRTALTALLMTLTTSIAQETRPVDVVVIVDTPLYVDVEAIDQILGNLVDNAAKYASGAAAQNGSLVLTVRNHGPGIRREQARVVFEPLSRT